MNEENIIKGYFPSYFDLSNFGETIEYRDHRPKAECRIKPIPTTILDRTECTTDEKRTLLPLIAELVALHYFQITEGLLSLDDKIDGIEEEELQKDLRLVINGTDFNTIQDFLSRGNALSQESGVDLLRQLLIRIGVLSLAKQNRAGDAAELLLSMIPGMKLHIKGIGEVPSSTANGILEYIEDRIDFIFAYSFGESS